ncbi:hypothetical protein KKF05_00770 [Patescibacteria group bacterium]|nr:hypothetical protein [Patescibacteria group bacterium]MBU1028959.1 hypothetical protein [Patescibacteria group bacterium]MBU1916113.1 hypothetical protein [Patescibacteria group bacterium]
MSKLENKNKLEGPIESTSTDDPKVKISVTPTIIFGVIITIGLAAIFFALSPLWSQQSSGRELLVAFPLFLFMGAAISLAHYSINRGTWHLFHHPKLCFLSLIGVPLVMLGLTADLIILWVPGFFYLVAAMAGLINYGGLMKGFLRTRLLLLIALSLGILSCLGWLHLAQNLNGIKTDSHGCLIGEMEWCEKNQRCIQPWVEHCSEGNMVDAFNVLKKIHSFSGLKMSMPVVDNFSWMAEQGSDVVNFTIPGLTTHLRTNDLNSLDKAFILADFEPDMVNSYRIGNGGLRGYRLFHLMVCAASFADVSGGKEGELDIVISCGRWDQAELPSED